MKSLSLARMQAMALGLLLLAAAVYAVAVMLRGGHAAWGYVAAFAEAAMVGGVADWFAVSALFRHPLGVPVPHTAIIASNKDRIGHSLARFICSHFLTTPQVISRLERWNVPHKLARWLVQPEHAQQVAQHLGATAAHALSSMEADPVQQFFVDSMLQRLRRFDAAQLAAKVLHMLTAGQRHSQLLDDVLVHVAGLLDDATLKEKIADVVAEEVKYLRFVGLEAVAGRYATEKLLAGVVRLVTEMGQDPAHALRLRFNGFMVGFADRLASNAALRAKVDTIWQELLAHPELQRYLHQLWADMVAWARSDVQQPVGIVQERVAEAVQHLGAQLLDNAPLQQWLAQQLVQTTQDVMASVRAAVSDYIVARVAQWDAQDMAHELEQHIGRDLQFIRINGTLVGGLVGLLIYSATEFFRHG
jgi:uncharacterized membrane-anchored protein YjiN (DUF445 family)